MLAKVRNHLIIDSVRSGSGFLLWGAFDGRILSVLA